MVFAGVGAKRFVSISEDAKCARSYVGLCDEQETQFIVGVYAQCLYSKMQGLLHNVPDRALKMMASFLICQEVCTEYMDI